MAEKPTYKELEQRIKELEKEAAEHKQAKEALKKSEQKYQHLTESLLDTVYEFDREGRFTYVNEAGTHMFGYSKQEILNGLRVQDTMIESDRAISQKVIGDIFNGKTTVGERAFLRKDGSQFIGEIHSGPIYMGEKVGGGEGCTSRHHLIKAGGGGAKARKRQSSRYSCRGKNIEWFITHLR